jgi:hypothetical protein
MRIWQFLGDFMAQIRQMPAYRDVRKNYCFQNKKIVENNLSICQFERKDNKINAYLSKILPNCLTFHISQSVRYVSSYQKHSNTNRIFAKKKLSNFLKSLKVPRLLYINLKCLKGKSLNISM